jgi:hypothetical protein
MTTENIVFEIEETVVAQAERPSLETSDFGFTRYLYIVDDVKSSLILALLDRNHDEALFWAYELYFSGFKEEVFGLLETTLDYMYRRLHPGLAKFLEKKKQEWKKTGSYCILGTFVVNMVNRQYDVSQFVKTYCKDDELIRYIDSVPKPPVPNNKIYVIVEEKDVRKYLTVNHAKPHYLLRSAVKYPVRRNTLAIFDHEHGALTQGHIQSLYWYYWLYYAGASPIWKDRIAKYGGVFNHERFRIDFANYEQDEEFHNKYNLEPDEQPKEIQNMNIGTGLEEQMSWLEFYEKYG